MKKQRFSDEQIICILREVKPAFLPVSLCRKHVSDTTFYTAGVRAQYRRVWRCSEVKRHKSLEEENAFQTQEAAC